MPYLLPAGDAYTAEKRCLIVTIPNKDEYLYALMGSLDYLGTWVAWERDAAKRGRDAARAWKEANEETRACMMVCDDIVSLLEQILDTQCCGPGGFSPDDFLDGGTTIAPTEDYVNQDGSDVVRDVGDPPASSTWAAYDEALCAEATAFVDETLPAILDILEALVGGIQSVTIAFVTTVAAAIVGITGIAIPGIFLSVGALSQAVEIVQTLINGDETGFDVMKANIAANRQTLICSIVNENTPEAAYNAFMLELQATDATAYDWIRANAPMPYLIRRLFNEDTDFNNSGGFGGGTGDCSNCSTPPPAGYAIGFDSLDDLGVLYNKATNESVTAIADNWWTYAARMYFDQGNATLEDTTLAGQYTWVRIIEIQNISITNPTGAPGGSDLVRQACTQGGYTTGYALSHTEPIRYAVYDSDAPQSVIDWVNANSDYAQAIDTSNQTNWLKKVQIVWGSQTVNANLSLDIRSKRLYEVIQT